LIVYRLLCDKLSVEAISVKRQTVCVDSDQQKFLNNFGKRMSEVRKKKGVTQEQLANTVELHRTYIGFIEQGKRNPSIGNIYKIATALDMPLKDLFKPFS
jgi:DNA-binding XRE family transcriptional regulator